MRESHLSVLGTAGLMLAAAAAGTMTTHQFNGAPMRPAPKHAAKPKSLLHPTKGYRGAPKRLFKKGTNRRAKPRKILEA